MTDFAKLKELAEAAGGVRWEWWTSNSTLRLTTETEGRSGADGDAISAYQSNVECPVKYRDFIAAANPAVVLGLIADNERLLKLLNRMVDQHVPLTELEGVPGWSRVVELVEVTAERDALKADMAQMGADLLEIERLRRKKDAGHYSAMQKLKAECEGLRVDAALGRIALGFIDRLSDPIDLDPIENSASELVAAIAAAMSKEASNG
ncbi:hypothetical protein QN382_19850 [Pseudomonas sp. 10B1]|uniref:hypothetical protein n=1 Tax=Pseudomonas sp. 10B1 TaxID=3048573 RepID=UPI002B2309ED|nr:hypothetical protein [Pseudomonas sp. 10B1]MEB0311531.1 hypothetical protein [Pseudomonas sp. 10B1]